MALPPKKPGAALMIGIGPAEGPEEDAGNPAEEAAKAFTKAVKAGDPAMVLEAFKELLASVDDEAGLEDEEPTEETPPEL